MPRKPTIFGQAKRGDIITDCIGERFLVLGKDKTMLYVADLQDRGFKIAIPKDLANQLGKSLDKQGYLANPHHQELLKKLV